jgi:mRNA interferase HicA
LYHGGVTSAEFKRWLERRGCTFEAGKRGHLKASGGLRRSVVPMHGSNKELPKGLVESIKRQLGLK